MRERLNNWIRWAFDAYADLTDREQKLLTAMAIVVPLAGLAFFGLLVDRSFKSIEDDIRENEQILEMLEKVAPRYKRQKAKSDPGRYARKFAPKKIENNKVKLTSFVATHATATGVNVDSYDENDRPLESGGKDGSTLMKHQVIVEINEVQMAKLTDLLERIELSEKPVFIERTKLVRRRNAKGSVRATLVVTTFKRKAKG
ncbi:MAG: hypothetical protein ABEL76_16620 [Bradymonadaceae bacterium]